MWDLIVLVPDHCLSFYFVDFGLMAVPVNMLHYTEHFSDKREEEKKSWDKLKLNLKAPIRTAETTFMNTFSLFFRENNT